MPTAPAFVVAFCLMLACGPLRAAAQQPAGTQNLIDIYHQALSQDPAWASARSANLAAQEKLEQGKALYRPTVTFNTNASESETNVKYLGQGTVFRNEGRERFNTFAYGLNVSQPIFRKDNLLQYAQSRLQVSQADQQLQLARQQLMLRVAQAYFDVLLAQDNIELIVAQKSAISHQLEQAQTNFDVGTATITDVNEAQARFDLASAQEIAARNVLEVKQRAVQAIIGSMPQTLAPVRTDLAPQQPQPADMDHWVELAWQNSLAIAIEQQNLAIATREVERARAGHLPTLDAVASYSESRNSGSANGFGSDLENLTVGVQLEIPLYRGGAVSSRTREAAANMQKSQEEVELARRQVELDTRQAYLDVSSGVAQIKAFEQALTSSQSQLDATNLGYEVGVRTSVDVLNALQQLYSAKRDLLQARYGYLLATIRLKSAIGLLAESDLTAVNQQLQAAR